MGHNKLHFYCLVDKSASSAYRGLAAYIKEMTRLYPCEFTIEEYDGAEIDWVLRNNKYYASDSYVLSKTKSIKATYGNKVDSVKFFTDGRNWKNGAVQLNGFKLGRVFDDYYVTFTKFRRGYEGTAEHEDLHFIDEYVKVNTGVLLETVTGVKDFDQDVVHGAEYWKRGYDYDKVWQLIGAHVSNAVFKRRNGQQDVRAQLLAKLTALLQLLRLLQYKSNSIPAIEIKKHHTTKCYNMPLLEENAVIGHIDLGTEAGTINEILNGARSASYHWYIPKHAKYVIEFVPKEKSAWHAGALHNPDQGLGELLGGANELIESGEPNNYSYGICYEGLTVNTAPNEAQIALAAELVAYKKIDQLPWFAHWQVTSYKPKIVTQFVEGVTNLLNKK